MRFIINFVDTKLAFSPQIPNQHPEKYNYVVSKIIDSMSGIEGIGKVVIVASLIILALALLRGFFMFLMRQTIIVMSRRIEYDQKNEVYTKYQQLDTEFFKKNKTGDLMNRISEDVSRVRIFTGPAIMYVVNLISVIGFSVFFMLQSSIQLTIYTLIPLPILAVVIYFVNSTIHKKSERIQQSLSNLTTNAQESYSGIRVIKSFVQEKAMLSYFKENSEAYRANAISLAKVEAIYFPSIMLLIGISTLLTIMIGGLYYINGQHDVTLGTIVEFIVYVNMLTFPVSAIGLTASMIQRAAASQKRLNEFLDIAPHIKDEQGSKDINIEGDVVFDNVNFKYPDTGIEALKDFSLHIKKGEKIAITGKTGSGKTTLAQLMLRMYELNAGTIRYDGHDISEFLVSSLRKQISYVPQDVFLFSDTVENNIRFAIPNASRDEVVEAAEMAGVAKEIEQFSDGYLTMIGERGVTLSGGQKQRVSIARALLKKPSLIIFDDCLSAVDAKTEQEIMSRLQKYLENRTAVIITHRVFSLLSFDRIIVLDEGRIAEQGSHDELMKIPGGFYAKLYTRQQQGRYDNEAD